MAGVSASSTAGTHVSAEVGTRSPGGVVDEAYDAWPSSPTGTSGSVVNAGLTPTSVG